MESVATIKPQQELYICTKGAIKSKVKNWSKNRPHDEVRVKAIAAYLEKFDVKFLDGIVYCWSFDGYLHIYDGWTRYCAASDETKMMLCVYTTDYEQDIVHHFFALNSAVPVPSLYIKEEQDGQKKLKIIEEIVKDFSKDYKQFLSASRRPQKPNFNRDTFAEQLSQLPIENLDAATTKSILMETNQWIKRNGTGFTRKAIDGDFFLFADKKILWQQRFLEVLEKNEKKETTSWFSRIGGLAFPL